MSKKTLRKLIRQRDLPEDEERLNSELYEGSDHTAVLLSVSQLQSALEGFVVDALAVKGEAEVEPLFEPGGLLASFHLVIQQAYVLGLISKTEREDLDRIKSVRNVFAHAMRPVGFHMDIIADEAKKLPLTKEFTDEYPECTPRERFVFCTLQLGTEFTKRSVRRTKSRIEWLNEQIRSLEVRNALALKGEDQ